MKFFILLFLFVPIFGIGQQDQYFAGDGFTPFWNNPAATGSLNQFSANVVYKNQWPALSTGYENLNFNVEGDVFFSPKKLDYKLNVPLGLNVMFERIGAQRTQLINVPFVIPVPLGESTLALGLSLGVKRVVYDWEKLIFIDPVLPEEGSFFNFNAGVFWHGENYYAGASVTNVNEPSLFGYQDVRHFNVQGAYKFELRKLAIYPMINGTFARGFIAARAISYFQFNEDLFSIALGVNARSSGIFGATLKLKKFKVAYYYELYQSKLTNASGSSHEFRLCYVIEKK